MSTVDEPVSFERDIKPLFRDRDRGAMKFFVDLWSHDDVARESDEILDRLRDGSMPCDGAWDDAADRPVPAVGRRRESRLRRPTPLLLVTLDDLGRPELGALGALAGLSARAPLPQEIPALVERHAQRLQPLPVGVRRLPCRFSLPELVLLGDHPVDRTVDLGVLH